MLGTTAYTPDQGLQFGARDFVCDYLHICGGDIRDAKSGSSNDMTRALPTAKARKFKMPSVEVDSALFAVSLGGLQLVDAMFQPTFFLEGGLDTLYTCVPVRSNSGFNNKLDRLALRRSRARFRRRDRWPFSVSRSTA